MGVLAGQSDQAPHDVVDRVHHWCAVAAGEDSTAPPLTSITALPPALEGVEVAAARLIVASLRLDPAPALQERTAVHV